MDSMLCIPSPKKGSHKGQNGVALIIGGSKTYHGAPVLAALAAMRFCDLVYFHSTQENMQVLKRMKAATPNVICVGRGRLAFALAHATCVLVGNGMEVDGQTKKILSRILKSGKRCVIDAAALRCLPLSLLHKNAILTPHSREFEACFSLPANAKNAKAMSEKYCCTVLLKGESDFVASQGRLIAVEGGSPGMTKGGTGDALAGLACALFSNCPDPLRAAYTASVMNKRAGELLHRIFGPHFCSEDLVDELPFVAISLRHAPFINNKRGFLKA
jgi:NAD(P)H-hydrate epimerase